MFFKNLKKNKEEIVYDLATKPLIDSENFEYFLKENFFGKYSSQAIDLRNKGFCLLKINKKNWINEIDHLKSKLEKVKEFTDNQKQKINQNLRFQDAWKYQEINEVRKIANEQMILDCLKILYGREPFPFQTLNFPYGSQQHVHSDAVHFSSIPNGFMCGVWIALEDVSQESGPLIYYPFSHKSKYISSKKLGIEQQTILNSKYPQKEFEFYWRELIKKCNYEKKQFLAKKGEVFIWHANLLHGGDKVLNQYSTRWSQVTHYYFRNCYYYNPFFDFEYNKSSNDSMTRNPTDLIL